MQRVLGVAVVLAALPLPAAARTVADWQMNEARGAQIMRDRAGDHDGLIGERVAAGGGVYRFPGSSRDVYDPRRILVVPESNELDPQRARFQVEIRFRTRHVLEPNLVQKGQHGQAGGYFKVALFNGRHPRCGFHDGHGRVRATGRRDLDVTDGRWWTLRCTATGTATTLVVLHRGRRYVSVERGRLGRVDNDKPLVIGGKLDCAAADVDCDYFRGQIDHVTVRKWP